MNTHVWVVKTLYTTKNADVEVWETEDGANLRATEIRNCWVNTAGNIFEDVKVDKRPIKRRLFFSDAVNEWFQTEVGEYMLYVDRIADKISAWRAEYGYVRMCQLVDYQKIGAQWKDLASKGRIQRKTEIDKIVLKHFDSLQRKVEERIGNILEIVSTGDNGWDYDFIGEKGKTGVKVIAAGGYNIQCAHTRWVFTDKAK